MTPEILKAATDSTLADARLYCLHLDEAMARFGITSKFNRACFIGTVDVESGSLSAVEESLYYREAQYLANTYPRAFQRNAAKAAPYTRNSAKLGQLLYQGYWGRGLIQLTWLSSYVEAGKALGFDYVNNPKLLTEPWHAAMSAGWFWSSNGCNPPGDRGDIDACTRIVNGPGMKHLSERRLAYRQCLDKGV